MADANIKVYDGNIENITPFENLGSMFTNDGDTKKEVQR